MSNLTGDNGMVMPVSPMYGNGGGGFGNWGDSAWIIILLLFAFGGWGNNGYGGNMGGMLYPWMNQQLAMQSGFDQAATASALAGINTSITNGFANQEVAACGRAANQMQTDYQNQIASMQQSFSNAQALDSRLDAIQTAQQTCCCENKAQIADLKYTIATEAAANRAAALENTRVITDKLCQLELDGVRGQLDAERRENATLQNQLNMATLRESQTAQTAALVADNTAQTRDLIQRIAPYPTPSYSVPNPFAGCGYNGGCGCVA